MTPKRADLLIDYSEGFSIADRHSHVVAATVSATSTRGTLFPEMRSTVVAEAVITGRVVSIP